MSAKYSNLTENSIFKGILVFSIPLMFSYILQAFFNMTDIAVVGKFSGANAMGSVGSTSQLIYFFTGLIQGLGSGINVITAFYIGKKSQKEVSQTVQTSLIISLIAGIFVAGIAILLSRPILSLMKTKDELLDGAVLYFRIYISGLPAMAIYNFGNGVFNANGDTKKSLYFLLISGIINVFLDIFFVVVLKMDVDGVALASIISQYVCAICIIYSLTKEESLIKLSLKKIKFNLNNAFKILKIGIPAGIQNAIFAFANVFIQIGMNSFSAAAVTGNSAAANADTLIYGIMNAFYVAESTYISQNYGAGKKNRIIKTYFISTAYAFFSALILGILLLIFGKQFLSIFTNDSEVIEFGLQRISIMALSYCVAPFMDSAISASRGLGKSFIPSMIVISGSCIFRIVWIYTIFAYFDTIRSLYLLYVFSWAITAIPEIIYFAISYKKINAN